MSKNYSYDKSAIIEEARKSVESIHKIKAVMEEGLSEKEEIKKVDLILGYKKLKLSAVYSDLVAPELKKTAFKWISSKKLFLELEKTSQRRARFRGNWQCKWFTNQPPDVAYCSGFYENILRRVGRRLEYDVRDLVVTDIAAKAISQAAFIHGEYFSPNYRFYCHIKRLKDFKERVSPLLFLDEITYWQTPKWHGWNGDEELFYTKYNECVSRHTQSLDYVPPQQEGITLEKWLSNRTNWANSGSGYVLKLRKERTSVKGIKKTKWYDAWTITDEDLLDAVINQKIAYNKVLQKPEIEKVRGIVGADLITYLRMKFVWDTVLSGYYKNWKYSTLFMSTTERFEMWTKIAKTQGWNLPLDQTEFDQMQTKRQIILMFKGLSEKIRIINKEASVIWELMIESLENGIVLLQLPGNPTNLYAELDEIDVLPLSRSIAIDGIRKGEATWPYANGVQSGWYLTAFTDTILNYLIFTMAEQYLKEEVNMSLAPNYLYCQGDDDALSYSSYAYANALSQVYPAFGFKVNRNKFFISKTRQEFLRKSVSNNRVDGYPARTVTNLLFTSPELALTGDEDVASSRVSLWHRFSCRLGCELRDLPWEKDVRGATGWAKWETYNWASTPRAFGGGGIHERTNYKKIYEVEVVSEKQDVIPVTAVWVDFKEKWKVKDDTLFSSTMVKSARGRKRAKVVETNSVTIASVRLPSTTLRATSLLPPYRPPRLSYLPEIGKLGKYTEIRALNADAMDTLLSNFTAKLKRLFLEEGLKTTSPLVRGISEEYTSFWYSYFDDPIFRYLTYKHRANIWDFKRANFYVGETVMNVDVIFAE